MVALMLRPEHQHRGVASALSTSLGVPMLCSLCAAETGWHRGMTSQAGGRERAGEGVSGQAMCGLVGGPAHMPAWKAAGP